MSSPSKIGSDVQEKLGHYVYAYYDDRGRIFYIGKGQRGRCLEHWRLAEHCKSSRDAKQVKHIREILRKRRKPKVILIKHAMSEEEADKVESALISLLRTSPRAELVNAQSGTDSNANMLTIRDINALYAKKKAALDFGENTPDANCILVNIRRSYKEGADFQTLYDITRKAWPVKKERLGNISYVMPVYKGVILEVFKVAAWLPANATFSKADMDAVESGEKTSKRQKNRYEFVGRIADEKIRKQFRHRAVAFKGRSVNYRFSTKLIKKNKEMPVLVGYLGKKKKSSKKRTTAKKKVPSKIRKTQRKARA